MHSCLFGIGQVAAKSTKQTAHSARKRSRSPSHGAQIRALANEVEVLELERPTAGQGVIAPFTQGPLSDDTAKDEDL